MVSISTLRGPSLGSGIATARVAAVRDRHHQAGLFSFDAIDRHAGEGGGHHLVDEVRAAAAQVVGEIADDGLFAQRLLDFVAQIFAHVLLLAMAEGVGFAVFLEFVILPVGAFGKHDQRVIARIAALVGHQQLDQLLEIELVLRNAAAHRGDVGGIERRVAGVAAEDAEDADALVRADRGALALDGLGGAA